MKRQGLERIPGAAAVSGLQFLVVYNSPLSCLYEAMLH